MCDNDIYDCECEDRYGETAPSSCTSELPCSEHWAVHIYVSGKCLLSIGHNHLEGVEDIMRHSATIRTAANHLLGFIGDAQNSVLDRKQANPAGSLPLSDGVLRAPAVGGEMKGWHYMSEQSELMNLASDALLAEIRAERERWEKTQARHWGERTTFIYYTASGTVVGLQMAEDIITEHLANANLERSARSEE